MYDRVADFQPAKPVDPLPKGARNELRAKAKAQHGRPGLPAFPDQREDRRESRISLVIPSVHRATKHDQSAESVHRYRHLATVMGRQGYELGATLNSALTYKPDRGHGAMLQDQQPHQWVCPPESAASWHRMK